MPGLDNWTCTAHSAAHTSCFRTPVWTVPYNTIAFKFVPPQVRPLTHATVSATFNVAVSAVTLGYFDTWCDRAVHLFGA